MHYFLYCYNFHPTFLLKCPQNIEKEQLENEIIIYI